MDYLQEHRGDTLLEPRLGVYVIQNTVTKRVYIGVSTDVLARWVQHRRRLQAGRHMNRGLQEDYDKFGLKSFTFQLFDDLSEAPARTLMDREHQVMLRWSRTHVLYNQWDTGHLTRLDSDRWEDLE